MNKNTKTNTNTQINTEALHIPVLLDETLHYLAPVQGASYLDLTAGYGGHASRLLAVTNAPKRAVLVDRDSNAIHELERRFEGQGATIRHQDFFAASQQLVGVQQFDMILADLGVSSPHLNQAQRGFAIQQEGPLDMRMDQSQQLTAADIVNTYDEAALRNVLLQYGEEPKATRIARLIVQGRPLVTTSQLAAVVARAYPGHSKTHPATRTFQALRIAVNDELRLLEQSLPLWLQLLAPGGRLAVISFHSLEDRMVKQFFIDHAGARYDADLRLITKRPVVASNNEIVLNPRSRSAKLRVAANIKTKTKGETSHANTH
jgi:16S rRNA (cytosine1402-N4)-methyltransferase